MNRRTAAGALFFLAMLLTAASVQAAYNVRAAIVMDMNSRQILYEQNADQRIAPASLTKILAMYLVWEDVRRGRVKLADRITVSKKAVATGGSSMLLKAGESVTLSQLMHGMAIASGNDASISVAEYIGGGVDAFVERMNRKAKSLGMYNSTFKNPHGLPAPGQLTTARDMLLLTESYLRHFPDSLTIHSKTHMFHNQARRNNSNKLLGAFPGLDGLKTGYVNASRFNIVVTAQRNGRRLIAVVLGGETSAIRNAETRKLLETCFAKTPDNHVRLANRGSMGQNPVQSSSAPIRQAAPLQATYGADSGDVVGVDYQPASYRTPSAGYVLHESSWRTSDKAMQRVGALRKRGISDVRFERVDLGEKGIWHRVYIGSFQSASQAKRYMQSLQRSMPLQHVVVMQVDS